MTRQTTAPLERLPLDTFNRQAREMVRLIQDGDLDLNPPYQRGAVWTEDQRVALVRSWLTGIPIPTLIINDRGSMWWTDTEVYDRRKPVGPSYVVIDGKQRLLAAVAWMSGDLAVPASWFDPEHVAVTEDTDDGPYVRLTGLTDVGQRMAGMRIMLPTGEAKLATMREEAATYLLVNGGGTPQSDADMDNAARVAAGHERCDNCEGVDPASCMTNH